MKGKGWSSPRECSVYWCDGFFEEETFAYLKKCSAKGVAKVPIQVDGSHLWIGPVCESGRACLVCLKKRFEEAMDPYLKKEVWLKRSSKSQKGLAWVLPMHRRLAEQLAHELFSEEPLAYQSRIYKLNLRDLSIQPLALLRDSRCRFCGQNECDDEHWQKNRWQSPEMDRPGHYRLKPLKGFDFYRNAYIQKDIGLFVNHAMELDGPTMAPGLTSLFSRGGLAINAGGHELSFEQSLKVSTVEALERYMGLSHRRNIQIVEASYREVSSFALHPPSAGLPLQCEDPLESFDPEKIYPWVWAYSQRRKQSILVPYQMAYYDQAAIPGERFVHDNSNGCAVGNTLEEALFFGLLELIERDHFMLTWFGQCALDALDVRSLESFKIHALLDRMALDGMKVHVFAMKFDLPICAILALAERRDGGFGSLVFAAGCHPNLEQAVYASLVEVASYYPNMNRSHSEHIDDIRAMYGDFTKVRRLKDHQALWCLPEMRAHAEFLLEATRKPTLTCPKRLYAQATNAWTGDLKKDLNFLMSTLHDSGHEVICIDQTPEELCESELKGVRVLVPGLVPISFGFPNRRLRGLKRLWDLPQKMGYRSDPLHFDSVNPIPHPFP